MTTNVTALTLGRNPLWNREARWRSVIEEMARDIFPIEMVLENHGIAHDEWVSVASTEWFQAALVEAKSVWNSSLNTRERIELKTLSMMEGALPEMYRVLHDPAFSHAAKVELFKAFSRNLGIGVKEGVQATGERVSITINMGDDRKVELQDVTPRVIENNPTELVFDE